MIAKKVPARRQTSSVARLVKYIVNAQGELDPRSWERTADYILAGDAEKNERGEKVGGVRVTNCGTDDPAAATVLIQSTQAINTKSKKEKTYHLVFSFPPGENPSLDVLNQIEDELCASIGFADHQRISAVHVDTDHLHVHVAINKVHPTGFQNIEPYYDMPRLMEACERLEIKHGLERTNHGIKEKNHDRKIKLSPEVNPTERESKFRGYLRKSNDFTNRPEPAAKSLNGLRNLSSSTMARLTDRGALLLPSDARNSLEQGGKAFSDSLRRPGNGDRTATSQRTGIGGSASNVEQQTGVETLAGYVAEHVAPAIKDAKDWQAVHSALAEHGLEIKPRGAGLVIGDAGLSLWVRASQCGREMGFKQLTDRLGPFDAPKGNGEPQQARKGAYTRKPLHNHTSTANLYAQYQREKQQALAERKAGHAAIKAENGTYLNELKRWTAQQRLILKVSGRGLTRRAMSATITAQTAAARNKHRAAIKTKREQLYKATSMPSWADWLSKQAQAGNADALDVLRSRADREQKLQGDLLTAANAEKAKSVILDALRPATRRDGTVSYRTADGGMVIDRSNHVQAQKATTGAAFVALSIAAQKFDGQPLIVEGTEQFKKDVAQLAAIHKLNVVFADPAMERERVEILAANASSTEKTTATATKPTTKPAAPEKPQKSTENTKDAPQSVTNWIEKRNSSRDKISSIDYHRLWRSDDAGKAIYQGRRKMDDGSEVLLLKRGDDLLVKPSGPRVIAKASKFKIGQSVTLDAKGRLVVNSRVTEL